MRKREPLNPKLPGLTAEVLTSELLLPCGDLYHEQVALPWVRSQPKRWQVRATPPDPTVLLSSFKDRQLLFLCPLATSPFPIQAGVWAFKPSFSFLYPPPAPSLNGRCMVGQSVKLIRPSHPELRPRNLIVFQPKPARIWRWG